jgi:hypothetical protein
MQYIEAHYIAALNPIRNRGIARLMASDGWEYHQSLTSEVRAPSHGHIFRWKGVQHRWVYECRLRVARSVLVERRSEYATIGTEPLRLRSQGSAAHLRQGTHLI